MSVPNPNRVLEWALKEVRHAAEQGETTSVWAHSERYPQLLAILSHRLNPDVPDGKDVKKFDFGVQLPDHHRVCEIHGAIEGIVKSEDEILEIYGRVSDEMPFRSLYDASPKNWADVLTDSEIQSIEENLNLEQEQIDDDWKPHELFETILSSKKSERDQTFYIYCALNLVSKDRNQLSSVLNIGDTTVRAVNSDDWDTVVESATSSESVRNIEHPEQSFRQYTDSDSIPSDNTVSYWRVEHNTSSIEEANVEFRRTIQAVLGGVTAVLYDYDSDYTQYDIPEYSAPIDASHVPMPPFYIICDSDHECRGYGTTHEGEYGTPHRISSGQSERVNDLFVRTGCHHEITDAWRKGLAAYHRSFNADTIVDEYHYLWQAVEALVMTDEATSESKEIIEYGSGAVKNQLEQSDSDVPWRRPSRYELLEMRIDVLRRRRNHVVHGGEETEVYSRDTASLRIALDGLIKLYLGMLSSGVKKQAAEGILWYGHKSSDSLTDSIDDLLNNKVDLKRKITEKKTQIERRESAQNWNGYE